MGVEYSSEHKDSMEEQLTKLVHAFSKKVRDVKQSYGKRIRQLSLKLEHLQGILLYEQDTVLIPLNLKPTNMNGRKIMQVLCLLKDNWIKNSMRFNKS
jgi:hypothetical protein